jgi:dienelactone hydrolase
MNAKCIRPHLPKLLLLLLLLFAPSSRSQQTPAPRVVDLPAPDGMKLKATYFAATKSAPGVLLLHQCNRQRKVWDDLASHLAAAGLNVLTLDYRGFGESGGTPIDKLTNEARAKLLPEKLPVDVETAFQYLIVQPGVTRDIIGVGGASCGVNLSIQVARHHPEVKSLVLLSGATDHDGRQFVRNSPNLPLFISAADDDANGLVVEFMQWLFSLSPDPADKFQRYANGGHGVEMFAAHEELPGMIVEWFGSTLRPGSSVASSKSTAPQSRGAKSRELNILELIDQPGGASKAAKQLAEARQRDPKAILFSEAIANQIGYEHLQSGDTKGAVEIMKLNVTAHPNSANAYDSLSDAYLADGQKDVALQNAKKSLELLPLDKTLSDAFRDGLKANVEQKLKQLGESPH